MSQSEKALALKALHVSGDPLVLYNIWDAGTARAVAKSGAKAIATGSWSVAAAHGFMDGEAMPLDLALTIIKRIALSVDLPVSVDFEGGYAVDPAQVAVNVIKVIEAGAVGINFEDQIMDGGGMYSIPDQTARIAAIRAAAQDTGVALFINARTDMFLQSDAADHASLMDDAKARQVAYADAGADGFFVPGLTDPALIKTLCKQSSRPVNVMMMRPSHSVHDYAGLGVSRISFGPGPYINALADMVARLEAV